MQRIGGGGGSRCRHARREDARARSTKGGTKRRQHEGFLIRSHREMILSHAQHERLSGACYRRVCDGEDPPPPSACASEGLPYDALHALHLAAHARHAKQTAHEHRKKGALAGYAAAFAGEERTLLEIATSPKVNASPCLLARLLIEHLLGVPRGHVGAYLRNPALLPDARWRREVAACVAEDAYNSPLVDRVKQWAGWEHEWRLQAALLRGGGGGGGAPAGALCTEEELRARGLRKTPDVLLRWPAWAACAHGAPALVTWLDSKAAFCEARAAEEAARQVADYARLFGPGAVVFWGGHVEELARGCCEGGGGGGAAPPPPLGRGVLLAAEPPPLLRWATREEVAALRAALEEDAGRGEGGEGLWLEEPPEQLGGGPRGAAQGPAAADARQAALRAAALGEGGREGDCGK